MTERDLIDALVRDLPRAPEQVNQLHESDAEILHLNGALWAVTVDDFSAQEDLFFAADPELVGWNVVAATLSDLFCVGAEPRFFLPAVCLPPRVSEEYVTALNAGVGKALARAACFLIGGDLGQAHPWRYVGTALGPITSGRPITRRIPRGSHTLWISGPLGSANVAAALGKAPPRFPLRVDLAETIRTHAGACMDTSGGFLDAAWSLVQTSPGARMQVEVEALPLAPEVADLAARTGMPREAALLGGAGEYELLFTVSEGVPNDVARRLASLGCQRIGRVMVDEAPRSLLLLRPDGQATRVTRPPPCPRSADSLDIHIREVVAMARVLFGVAKP
jgi:thiamine-monophosphate kinase